jgi:hypothetical protein
MQINKQPITITKVTNFKQLEKFLDRLLVVFTVIIWIPASARAEEVSLGFLFDRFPLTLADGWRTEAAGPFYYAQKTEAETLWALPPFFSYDRNPAVEYHEDDFLYPLLTHVRYGREQRWQFGQLISTSGGQEADATEVKRLTLFPFYFQQRAADTNLNYTAFVPFYGRLKNRLFRDEMYFIMFPIFGETHKRDIVTDNYFYPIGHVRHGDGLTGWQVWPLAGREHKDVTTPTNGFGDTTLVGGHDKSFFLWPFWLQEDTGIGTDNPEKFRASIPFFAISRSPQRDSTSVLWPIFATIDDRAKKYHEWQGPWPLVIFTRGEGKHTSRVFPLFSESRNGTKESDVYLWPLYTFKRTQAAPLDQQRTRGLIYLYSRLSEKNTETGAARIRLDMWPFFTWHHDFNGNERLQILAPLEPAVPDNPGIEKNWSPLWSLWRAEDNLRSGASSRSLLWNLYRQDTAPGQKKVSLLFGLFQYQSGQDTERTRLFYFTVAQTPPPQK